MAQALEDRNPMVREHIVSGPPDTAVPPAGSRATLHCLEIGGLPGCVKALRYDLVHGLLGVTMSASLTHAGG